MVGWSEMLLLAQMISRLDSRELVAGNRWTQREIEGWEEWPGGGNRSICFHLCSALLTFNKSDKVATVGKQTSAERQKNSNSGMRAPMRLLASSSCFRIVFSFRIASLLRLLLIIIFDSHENRIGVDRSELNRRTQTNTHDRQTKGGKRTISSDFTHQICWLAAFIDQSFVKF